MISHHNEREKYSLYLGNHTAKLRSEGLFTSSYEDPIYRYSIDTNNDHSLQQDLILISHLTMLER
jgi:spore coat polysaccharide biosynthesis protein SpsF (cytidylyltransferase family)